MIKVAPLVLIGALGLVLAPIPAPVLPEFSAVESVSLVALYAFVGFEAATIPAGETLSYGGLAERIGKPKAIRAVGLANGANPVAIIVPCHRVIGADGSLTGYGGGLLRKQWLLHHEGARLGRLI